jgi:hypothetical protein
VLRAVLKRRSAEVAYRLRAYGGTKAVLRNHDAMGNMQQRPLRTACERICPRTGRGGAHKAICDAGTESRELGPTKSLSLSAGIVHRLVCRHWPRAGTTADLEKTVVSRRLDAQLLRWSCRADAVFASRFSPAREGFIRGADLSDAFAPRTGERCGRPASLLGERRAARRASSPYGIAREGAGWWHTECFLRPAPLCALAAIHLSAAFRPCHPELLLDSAQFFLEHPR